MYEAEEFSKNKKKPIDGKWPLIIFGALFILVLLFGDQSSLNEGNVRVSRHPRKYKKSRITIYGNPAIFLFVK